MRYDRAISTTTHEHDRCALPLALIHTQHTTQPKRAGPAESVRMVPTVGTRGGQSARALVANATQCSHLSS